MQKPKPIECSSRILINFMWEIDRSIIAWKPGLKNGNRMSLLSYLICIDFYILFLFWGAENVECDFSML